MVPVIKTVGEGDKLAVIVENGAVEGAARMKIFLRDKHGVVDSRELAAFVQKRHTNVLRAIKNIEKDVSDSFRLNFEPIEINDLTGKSTSHYLLTRDAAVLVIGRFTGKVATAFQEAVVRAFVTFVDLHEGKRISALESERARIDDDRDDLRMALNESTAERLRITDVSVNQIRDLEQQNQELIDDHDKVVENRTAYLRARIRDLESELAARITREDQAWDRLVLSCPIDPVVDPGFYSTRGSQCKFPAGYGM